MDIICVGMRFMMPRVDRHRNETNGRFYILAELNDRNQVISWHNDTKETEGFLKLAKIYVPSDIESGEWLRVAGTHEEDGCVDYLTLRCFEKSKSEPQPKKTKPPKNTPRPRRRHPRTVKQTRPSSSLT